MFRKYLVVVIFIVSSFFSIGALAQETTKCTGDPQMCAEIMELRATLKAQKDLSDKQTEDKIAHEQQKSADEAARTAKFMAISAMIAVLLKIAISIAKGWIGYFKTDKGKAAIKIGVLVMGFGAFVLANIGSGVKWWQALIIAGGPPGAILVHELMDLVPVVQGKKKLDELPPEEQENGNLPSA